MDEYISYDLSLDVSSAGCDKQINVVQGERNSRFLYVTLTDGSKKIKLNALTDIAVIRGVKADDTVILNAAYILEDSRIYYKFGSQDTTYAGDSVYAVQIIRIDGDDKRILHTVFFKVHVGETLFNDEKISSSDEYGILLDEINKIDDAIYVDEVIEYKAKRVGYANTMTKEDMNDDIDDSRYIIIESIKKVTESVTDDDEIKGLRVGYFYNIYKKDNPADGPVSLNDVHDQELPLRIKKPYVPSTKMVGSMGIILEGAYDAGECWVKYHVCERMTLKEYIERRFEKKSEELLQWENDLRNNLTEEIKNDIDGINADIDDVKEKIDDVNGFVDKSKTDIEDISEKMEYIENMTEGVFDNKLSDVSNNALKNKVVKQAVDVLNGRIDNLLADYSEDDQYVEAQLSNVELSYNEMKMSLSVLNDDQKLVSLKDGNINVLEAGTYVLAFDINSQITCNQYQSFEYGARVLVNGVEKLSISQSSPKDSATLELDISKTIVVKLAKGDTISFLWKGISGQLNGGSVFMFMVRNSGELADARVDASGTAHGSVGEAIRHIGSELIEARSVDDNVYDSLYDAINSINDKVNDSVYEIVKVYEGKKSDYISTKGRGYIKIVSPVLYGIGAGASSDLEYQSATITFYDESKEELGFELCIGKDGNKNIDIPLDAKFITIEIVANKGFEYVNVDYRLSKIIDVMNTKIGTFMAEYGVTKYADIFEEYNNGRDIKLKIPTTSMPKDTDVGFAELVTVDLISAYKVFTFEATYNGVMYHYAINYADGWNMWKDDFSQVGKTISDHTEYIENLDKNVTTLASLFPLIDYVEIGAGEKYYIEQPGIYLFVGPDYKLNFYTANALGTYSIVGHENNLITALFVAEKHDNDEQLQIFWGKTYKSLAIASTESQNINGAWYTPKSRAPYVINTDNTNGAFLYYIKQRK